MGGGVDELARLYVFPAHAGMNRAMPEMDDLFQRVPRSCGDEPHYAMNGHIFGWCSPLMRG